MHGARALAILGALAGASGLVLQFLILRGNMSADGVGLGGIVWRFVGFFTILSNILVTAVMVRAALAPEARSELVATLEATGATAIVFVGVVYHALLARLWDPQGVQLIADILLHTVTPIVFALFWLLRPHGALKWRDAFICSIWPLSYAVYALVRGAGDGWYAYPFLDASKLNAAQLATSIAGLSAAFLAGALVLVALDKALARRT